MTDNPNKMKVLTKIESLDLATREEVLDWMEELDRHGPFKSLDLLRDLFEKAPVAAKNTRTYAYLEGLIDGRAIHEEFGGV